MDKSVPPGAAILLDFIRETEVGRSDRASYDVIYGHNQAKLPQPLTTMTYGEIVDAQKSWSKRFGSSAAGGYQFMRATLIDLAKAVHSISGTDRFTPDLQDRLGYRLLVRRGYPEFITGKISLVQFAENLAKEWASFPVLVSCKGAHRDLKRGQSYYAGDGVNRALVKPEKVEAVLEEILEVARRPHEVDSEAEPLETRVPFPTPKPPRKPVRKSGRFWTWLLTAGGTIVTALKELNLVALDWRVQIAILVVIVGFAVYAITSMPAVRGALGLK
jgi:muramidase (phage lysozyme)